jgi:predicted metal-dependent hydrolase
LVLDEQVNIGILIFIKEDSKLQFVYPNSLTRLTYLFPNIDLNWIKERLENFKTQVNQFNTNGLINFESIRDEHLLILDDNSLFFSNTINIKYTNNDDILKHYTEKYFLSYQ